MDWKAGERSDAKNENNNNKTTKHHENERIFVLQQP